MKRQGPRKPSSSPLCSPSPSDPALLQPPGWQLQMQALPCLCLPGTLHGSSVSHRIANHLLTWQPWAQPSTHAFPAEFSSRGPQPFCVPRGWSSKPGAVQGQLSLLHAGQVPLLGRACLSSVLPGGALAASCIVAQHLLCPWSSCPEVRASSSPWNTLQSLAWGLGVHRH